MQLSYIVPVFFDQQDTSTLIDLLKRYDSYGKELKKQIQFVIVDDCSPLKVQLPKELALNISLYRITSDIRWNQCGARNLGAVYAKAPKIILSDIDHYFPEKLLKDILRSKVPGKKVYKFKRVEENGRKIRKAMNIFYMSKGVFFDTLGYDEEFAGNYGYEDLYFLALLKRIGNRIRYFTRFQKIIANDVNRDVSYHSLKRDTTVNYNLYQKKVEQLKQGDPMASHSRSFLQFDWTLVEERVL